MRDLDVAREARLAPLAVRILAAVPREGVKPLVVIGDEDGRAVDDATLDVHRALLTCRLGREERRRARRGRRLRHAFDGGVELDEGLPVCARLGDLELGDELRLLALLDATVDDDRLVGGEAERLVLADRLVLERVEANLLRPLEMILAAVTVLDDEVFAGTPRCDA